VRYINVQLIIIVIIIIAFASLVHRLFDDHGVCL